MHLGPIELVFIILAVATGLSFVARRLRIAEPILFLLGGIVLGFLPALGVVPELPPIELEPDVVFLLFLPPILFGAAYFTPIRDFKANLRAILLLAVGLVLFTAVAVALVAQTLIPEMTWPVALALGAIVAPPDAVAATAVLQRLGVPRRVVTILEGESLVNDATSLIIYRTAVSAVAIGSASLLGAGIGFVVVGVGGLVVGVVIGLVITRALQKTGDPILEIILTLIAPISAYLSAELLGVSGVLATVVAGLMTGRRAARVLSPDARLMGIGVWQTLIWAINAFVFVLIGLQLPEIVRDLEAYSPGQLLGLGAIVSLTVIVARIVWVFPGTYLPRALSARIREREPYPPPRAVFIVSWAGMRGVVSLAAALALAPDFPQRDLILWLTFCVIAATLVGQGLSLPWLIRRLGITAGTSGDTEEAHARLAAVEAALQRLDSLQGEYPDHLPLIQQLKDQYDHEATHVWPSGDAPHDEAELELLDHRAIRNAVLLAEREAVIRLRDDGIINDETLRSIERDLDLQALHSGA
ncbi:MAG TPA: Na+/H+ antiporter [Candidatus Saccharimonadales bacterium]|nr:Na+/H+ antiporter [Candidatus Saccharimonadales bacterium]